MELYGIVAAFLVLHQSILLINAVTQDSLHNKDLTNEAITVRDFILAAVHRSQPKNIVKDFILAAVHSLQTINTGRYNVSNKRIGSGHFGDVYEAVEKATKRAVAIKAISLEKADIQSARAEGNLLMQMDFPFVLKGFESAQMGSKIFLIVTELAKHGTLMDIYQAERLVSQGRFPETDLRFFAAQIALGIQYLHEMNIFHRDIAPQNILIDENFNAKLADFGNAKQLKKGLTRTNSNVGRVEVGTPEINGTSYHNAVDWWAYGVTLYRMLGGPYDTASSTRFKNNWAKAIVLLPEHVTSEARDFLRKLLQTNADERLGGPKYPFYKSIMTHPFFSGIDWVKLLDNKLHFPRDRASLIMDGLNKLAARKQTN